GGDFPDHHPAGRALDRARLYRPHLRDLRARWHDQFSRHGHRGDADRHRREHHRDVLRPVLGAGGRVRVSADRACGAPGGPGGTLAMRIGLFWIVAAAVGLALLVATRVFFTNEYFFFAAYVVLQYVVLATAWNIVGGSRGIYIIRPAMAPLGGGYIQYLYTLMMVLVVVSVGIARWIERSRLGLGFAAIRDDEQAAEAGGVPTLRLKLIATTVSGALMGMAGAPLPYYVTYLDPGSSFNLAYAVNSVAMP